MKTNKGFRDENHADELRKAKRLEPIHKSGKERHTIYRELDDEEDDAHAPSGNRRSTISTTRKTENPPDNG